MSVNHLIYMALGITLIGGIFMALFAALFPQNLSLFLIGMTTYSFGSALCFAPLNRLIIEASDQPMGVRVGLFTVLMDEFCCFRQYHCQPVF